MLQDKKIVYFPFLLVLYEISMYLSNDAYLPAIPTIAKQYLISSHLAELTLTSWFIGAMSLQLVIGPLCDRYGRRPILLIGGLIFVVSSIICAFAPTYSLLLLARFLQGMAVPTMIIAGYAAINESFNNTKAIKIIATMNSVKIIAPAFGPLLGSAIIIFVDWRFIFILLAVWALLAILLLKRFMPETNLNVHNRINIKSITKSYYRILMNRGFIRYMLTFCFVIGPMMAWMLAGPIIIVDKYHLNTFYFGLFQCLIFLSYIIGSKFITNKITEKNITVLTRLGIAISFIGALIQFLLILLFPHALLILIVTLMVITFGSGFSTPVLIRLAISESDEPMGQRMTIVSLMQMTTAACFTLIISSISHLSIKIIATCSLITLILTLIVYFSFSKVKLQCKLE